jgi:hypothetical protein
MRRMDIDPLMRFGIDPIAIDEAAREYEGVRAAVINHGKFQITAEGCG